MSDKNVKCNPVCNLKINWKRFIFIICIAAAVIGIMEIYTLSLHTRENNQYLRKSRWGMSPEQVVKTEKSKPSQEYDGDTLRFEEKNARHSTLICYNFENNELVSAEMSVTSLVEENRLGLNTVKHYKKMFGLFDVKNTKNFVWHMPKSTIILTDNQYGYTVRYMHPKKWEE